MGHPITEQPGLRIREVRTIECKPVGLTVPGGEERVAKAHSRFLALTAEVANLADSFITRWDHLCSINPDDYDQGELQDDLLELKDCIDARAAAQEEMLRAIAGIPPQAGTCKFCHCTEENACFGGCSWLPNTGNTVCDAQTCVANYRDELSAEGKVL